MSEIRATTISDLAGTGPATLTKQSAAKAWIQIDGATTPVLQDSFNIASLSDLGVGYYGFSLTSSMSGTTYGLTSSTLQAGIVTSGGSRTTSGAELINRQSSDGVTAFDGDCSSIVNGDLA